MGLVRLTINFTVCLITGSDAHVWTILWNVESFPRVDDAQSVFTCPWRPSADSRFLYVGHQSSFTVNCTHHQEHGPTWPYYRPLEVLCVSVCERENVSVCVNLAIICLQVCVCVFDNLFWFFFFTLWLMATLGVAWPTDGLRGKPSNVRRREVEKVWDTTLVRWAPYCVEVVEWGRGAGSWGHSHVTDSLHVLHVLQLLHVSKQVMTRR